MTQENIQNWTRQKTHIVR